MSETSGGSSHNAALSGQTVPCKKCNFPNPPNVKFCGECGLPLQGVLCKRCNEANSADAKYCGNCGSSLFEMQRKPCILCNVMLPLKLQNCLFCSAPQDPEILDQTPLKQCFNSQCGAYLMVDLSICYRCKLQQPQHPPSTIPSDSPMSTSSISPAVSREQILAMYDPHPDQSNRSHHEASLLTLDVSMQPPMSDAPPPSGILPTAVTPDKAAPNKTLIVPDNNLDTTPMEVELSPSKDTIPKSLVSPPSSNDKRHCTNETDDSPDKKSKTEDTESGDDSSAAVFLKKGGAVVCEIVQPDRSSEGPHSYTYGIQGANTQTNHANSLSESNVVPDGSDSQSGSNTFDIKGMSAKEHLKLPPISLLPESASVPGVPLSPELHAEDDHSGNKLKDGKSQVPIAPDSSTENKTKPDSSIENSIRIQEDSTSKKSVNEARKRRKPDGTDEPATKKSLKDESPLLPEPGPLDSTLTEPLDSAVDSDKATQKESNKKEQKETLASQPQTTSAGDGYNDTFIGEASDTDITPVSSPTSSSQDETSQKQPIIESDSLNKETNSTTDPSLQTEVLEDNNMKHSPKDDSAFFSSKNTLDHPLIEESGATSQQPVKQETNDEKNKISGKKKDNVKESKSKAGQMT